MLKGLSFTSRIVEAGSPWVLRVLAVDDYGVADPVVLTAAVTLPDGTTLTPAPVFAESTTVTGVHRAILVPITEGRYVATVTDGATAVHFSALVQTVVTGALPVDVEAYNAWAGEHSHSDEDVQQAIDQETAAQWRTCRIPATYPPDLRGALLRRVQRALAVKALALGIRPGADDEADARIPRHDPEIRRLEAPYRKLVLG